MIDLIIKMQKNFGLLYEGEPRKISDDEFRFRLNAFQEEIQEYVKAYEINSMEEQFDALLDLLIFVVGAMLQHGFPIEKGLDRVMKANMYKVLVSSKDDSKRGYSLDLKKPEGWRQPQLADLVYKFPARGLIILDGPDACGKTTLAEFLEYKYNAAVFHSTWSPELEKRMDSYMMQTMETAMYMSTNRLVVLDRLWLSEIVYAEAYRQGSSRADLHNTLHGLLTLQGGHLIYCLPHNKLDVFNNFNKMKDSREEMYDDMNKIFDLYQGLWDGNISSFETRTPYLFSIYDMGGFCNIRNCHRYDWTTDGLDIEKFINNTNAVYLNHE